MFSVGSRLSFLSLLALLSLALTPVYSAHAESYDVEPSYFPTPEYSPEPEATPIYEEESATPEESPTYDEWPTPEETPLAEDSPEPEAEETPTYEEEPTPEETPEVEESPEPEAEETPTPAPPCGEEEGPAAGTGILPFQLAGGETIFEDSDWAATDDSGTRTYFRFFEMIVDAPTAAPQAPNPDGEDENTPEASLENYPDAAVSTLGYVSLTENYTCKPNGAWEITSSEWDGISSAACSKCSGFYDSTFQSWRNISYVNGTADYTDGEDSMNSYELDLRLPRSSTLDEERNVLKVIYAGPPIGVSYLFESFVSGSNNGLQEYSFKTSLWDHSYSYNGPGIWNELWDKLADDSYEVSHWGDGSQIINESKKVSINDSRTNKNTNSQASFYSVTKPDGTMVTENTDGRYGGTGLETQYFTKNLRYHETTGAPYTLGASSTGIDHSVNISWDENGIPNVPVTAADVSNYAKIKVVANQFPFPGSWPGIEESPGD